MSKSTAKEVSDYMRKRAQSEATRVGTRVSFDDILLVVERYQSTKKMKRRNEA
jgi:hypothetical protein